METIIIDTGFANILSIKKAVEFLGYNPLVTTDPLVISKGKHLILPGVGAFGHVMSHIKKSRIDNAIQEALVNPKNRILGICLGMQLLAESSEEGIFEPGLGLIKGISKKISDSGEIKVPHVGFNSISQTRDSQLLKDVPPNYNFYFLHSYALSPENTPSTVATVKYGKLITSVIEHNNQVYGTQFHPEKSQKTGLKVISNFLKI